MSPISIYMHRHFCLLNTLVYNSYKIITFLDFEQILSLKNIIVKDFARI